MGTIHAWPNVVAEVLRLTVRCSVETLGKRATGYGGSTPSQMCKTRGDHIAGKDVREEQSWQNPQQANGM